MTKLPQLPQTPEFQQAAVAVKNFVKLPNQKERLKFYGLYKFGCHGKNPEEAPKLLEWTEEGKKWTAWNDVYATGITPEAAQEQYIAFYEKVRGLYQAKV